MRMVSDLDRAAELNRRRLMQERTRYELDEFYAQPPAEQRYAGRMTEREYEDFERKRQQKFKYQILERISAGYDSVSAFDLSEAEALCQEDPEFKYRYLYAKAEYDARYSNKNKSQYKYMPEPAPVARRRMPVPQQLPPPVQREAISPSRLEPENDDPPQQQTRFIPKPIYQHYQLIQPTNQYAPLPYVVYAPANYDSRFNEIDLRFGYLSQMITQMQQFMQQSSRSEQQQMIQELQMMRMAQMQPQHGVSELAQMYLHIYQLEQQLAQLNYPTTMTSGAQHAYRALEDERKTVEIPQEDYELRKMQAELENMATEKKYLRLEIEQLRGRYNNEKRIEAYGGENLTVGVLYERNRLRWQMLQQMERDFE